MATVKKQAYDFKLKAINHGAEHRNRAAASKFNSFGGLFLYTHLRALAYPNKERRGYMIWERENLEELQTRQGLCKHMRNLAEVLHVHILQFILENIRYLL